MPTRALVTKELARLFGVFSHPHRIQIVEELRGGELDVNALEKALEISHSRVSQQLSILRAHRLVSMRREGRHAYYHLNEPDVARWLLEGLQYIEANLQSNKEIRSAIEEVMHIWTDDDEGAPEEEGEKGE